MLGIALGVAALIIVMSVMNGFQKEVRDRMLEVLSHIEVQSVMAEQGIQEPSLLQETLQQSSSQIEATAPYVTTQGLLSQAEMIKGVMIRGIDPQQEPKVTPVAARGASAKALQALQPQMFGAVLGQALADQLGVSKGQTLSLILPNADWTAVGLMPRIKTIQVLETLDTGHFEYDSTMMWMHIEDAQRLLRLQGPTGIRVALKDLHQAPIVAAHLQKKLKPNFIVSDWSQHNQNWFAAVQVEKKMITLILTLIVAVAAFNLVSMLMMTVVDKQSDIAILRTLGASPKSVMGIFMLQGAMIGVWGTCWGLAVGLLIAFHVDVIVPFIERLFHTQFLPPEIYLIHQMPSDPQAADIVPVVLISLILSFVATLYPSWKASQVQPAQALRYE